MPITVSRVRFKFAISANTAISLLISNQQIQHQQTAARQIRFGHKYRSQLGSARRQRFRRGRTAGQCVWIGRYRLTMDSGKNGGQLTWRRWTSPRRRWYSLPKRPRQFGSVQCACRGWICRNWCDRRCVWIRRRFTRVTRMLRRVAQCGDWPAAAAVCLVAGWPSSHALSAWFVWFAWMMLVLSASARRQNTASAATAAISAKFAKYSSKFTAFRIRCPGSANNNKL